ncbi:MAG: hypothetical protein ABI134_29685, partial [Byssovorax sp.]
MSQDVIPAGDTEFDDFQSHYIAKIVANPDTYGHSPQDVARLQAAQALWAPVYAKHKKAQIEAL